MRNSPTYKGSVTCLRNITRVQDLLKSENISSAPVVFLTWTASAVKRYEEVMTTYNWRFKYRFSF